MDERTALLGLRLVPGVGSGRLHKLLQLYDGSALRAWRERKSWQRHQGFGPKLAAAAASVDERVIEQELRRLEGLGARMLIQSDPDYPQGLQHIAGPAPVLFARGRVPVDYAACVALVGTRRASGKGLALCEEIARHLAAVGFGIVSGMALGIDGAAHRGALHVGGTTVAVLGCGLDNAYPRQHAHLMQEIAETGAVVTEYPLGTEPLPQHFPARNRIIAGLSAGVVLVESGRTGGALHTIDYAAAAGREVMAVPGDVARWQSEGPNQLIRDGAVLVRNAADVLHSLGHTSMPRLGVGTQPAPAAEQVAAAYEEEGAARPQADNPDWIRGTGERIVERLRTEGTLGADALAEQLRLSVGSVAAALTWLEVIGRVVRAPGGRFRAVD